MDAPLPPPLNRVSFGLRDRKPPNEALNVLRFDSPKSVVVRHPPNPAFRKFEEALVQVSHQSVRQRFEMWWPRFGHLVILT